MKTILKNNHLILVPETEDEELALGVWKEGLAGHVFRLATGEARGAALSALGPEAEACRHPINVTSRATDPEVARIGNLAPASFVLDGRRYASVEAFWQGLKFADEADRRSIAILSGSEAKRAGDKVKYGTHVTYQGREIPVGTREHWDLMHRACWAKFTQDVAARDALLATGTRPLEHVVRRDSRTIPGVIMAQIWMNIRDQLRKLTADELCKLAFAY